MLEFKVAVEKDRISEYLNNRGIKLDLKAFFVMYAEENGKIVGMSAVSMNPLYAVIEELVCDDNAVAYGMGKAVLNSLDLGGIARVCIKNERLHTIAEQLRFVKNSTGIYEVLLEGYFTSGC